MSGQDDLQQLLNAATTELDALEPRESTIDTLLAHGRWWAMQQQRTSRMMRVLLGGLSVYVLLFVVALFELQPTFDDAGDDIRGQIAVEIALSLGIPTLMLLVAAGLARRPSFLAQVFARSLLWVLTLAVGALQAVLLITLGEPGGLETAATNLVLTLTGVGGLLALGDHGLWAPASGSFRPAAFRGLLSLSLVLGLGDVVILVVAGLLLLPTLGYAAPMLGLAAILLLGARGLLRLQTWGLLVMALANVAEVVVLGLGYLDALGVIGYALLGTAVVQILLPLPVYLAMMRGRVPAQSRGFARYVPKVVLAAFALFSVVQFVSSLVLAG